MKKILAFLMAMILVMSCTAAVAAVAVNANPKTDSASLSSVTPFKFQHFKNGIGRGTLPVYTAPYENAYRCANGKAAVDSNSYIDLGGYNDQGWLLIRYSTNKGSTRVGWVPPKYIKGVKTSMVPHFSYIAQTAKKDMYVTDNNLDPYDSSSQFAMLQQGETFYVIGRYNYYQYDLWYISFYVGDQPACGFIFHDDI